MKPFKIKKDSWHYKLNANFMQGDFMERWEYFHYDFCSYWRATIGRLILAAFMLMGTLFILSAIAMAFYSNPVESALVAVAIILICAFITFVVWLGTRGHNKPSKPDSLFMQKYKAHKAKICPMVEYENE